MFVDRDDLWEVLRPKLRDRCVAEGQDFDEVLRSGVWPQITWLARVSGVCERKLRRILDGDQPADVLTADRLLHAVGLPLTTLELVSDAGDEPEGLASDLMLTVSDGWTFR